MSSATALNPLILNFDNSQGAVPNASELALGDWQEAIRFGCTLKTFAQFSQILQQQLPEHYGTVLLGSGDFHHLSWPLIEKQQQQGPFQVVLFDNHPDNMRFAMGIHCGSWVRKVALLPYVSHVHVLGVTSPDIALGSLWQQYWMPLLKAKVTYWCMDVDTDWTKYLGLAKAYKSFAHPDALIEAFLASEPISGKNALPTYLTIDKDVLSPEAVSTNWDQGRMLERHLLQVIDALKGRVIGSDITGEVSLWQYQTWWKRKLSEMDGQTELSAEQVDIWQKQQQALNARLLTAIAASTRPATN
jgi:Arginase family